MIAGLMETTMPVTNLTMTMNHAKLLQSMTYCWLSVRSIPCLTEPRPNWKLANSVNSTYDLNLVIRGLSFIPCHTTRLLLQQMLDARWQWHFTLYNIQAERLVCDNLQTRDNNMMHRSLACTCIWNGTIIVRTRWSLALGVYQMDFEESEIIKVIKDAWKWIIPGVKKVLAVNSMANVLLLDFEGR